MLRDIDSIKCPPYMFAVQYACGAHMHCLGGLLIVPAQITQSAVDTQHLLLYSTRCKTTDNLADLNNQRRTELASPLRMRIWGMLT